MVVSIVDTGNGEVCDVDVGVFLDGVSRSEVSLGF